MKSNCFDASSNDILELLSEMRRMTESSNKLDFDSPDSLSESDYLRLTGTEKNPVWQYA